jgi:4-oxalmesaconate hydratase
LKPEEARLIIDSHGHYTTAPQSLWDYRAKMIEDPDGAKPNISDDEIRESIETGQLVKQRERNIDVTLFSPRAGSMEHHVGNAHVSEVWSRVCNDVIGKINQMFPDNFIGVCQLPQSPGVSPANCRDELERCVNELGFVACNLSPDPTGGYWTDPPMTDKYWYPIYEKLVELDVPAMIHVSSSCNPNFHFTGAHYLCSDLSVFMQCIVDPQLFKDFPTLRFIIPHGGGAVPYHWGRYRGIALEMGRPELDEFLMDNIWFDTCVYHQPGMETLFRSVPLKNILFATEMIGAIRGTDPKTGKYFDDTAQYIDKLDFLSEADRKQVFEDNVRTVYPRLDAKLKAKGR